MQSRGDRPVHPADVVADLVLAGLGQLGPGTGQQTLGRRHPARGQPVRGPDQDLVGMMIEGDDGRSGGAGRCLSNEVPKQVRVAEMETVEHADDDEDPAEIGLERLDALDHEHRRCQATGAAGAGAAIGATKTRVGVGTSR